MAIYPVKVGDQRACGELRKEAWAVVVTIVWRFLGTFLNYLTDPKFALSLFQSENRLARRVTQGVALGWTTGALTVRLSRLIGIWGV